MEHFQHEVIRFIHLPEMFFFKKKFSLTNYLPYFFLLGTGNRDIYVFLAFLESIGLVFGFE